MGNNKTRSRGMSRNSFIVICCVLALVLAALIAAAWFITRDTSGESGTQSGQQSGAMEEMIMYTVEEQGDKVCVTTSYGDFSYPYAFSDLIVIEPVTEENCVGLAFSAYIEGKCEPVYTLWINGSRGVSAGTLHLEDKSFSVTIEMMDAREDLNADYLTTFYAVQETLNDVIQSMAAGGSFEYTVN